MNLAGAEAHECWNCSTQFRGKYCPHCGQSITEDRFDKRSTATRMVTQMFKFDNVHFWHTTKHLFTRPGHMMWDYIKEGHRVEYVRPFQLLLCLVTIYIILATIFHIPLVSPAKLTGGNSEFEKTLKFCFDWLDSSQVANSIFNLLVTVVPAWCCFKLSPRGKSCNLAEVFVVKILLDSIGLYIAILLLPVRYFSEPSSSFLLMCFDLVFTFLVFKQFGGASNVRSVLLTLLHAVLSFFAVLVVIVAFILVMALFYLV